VTSTDAATIDSLSKASRYLSGIGGGFGFDEALSRVESRSSAEVGQRLRELASWTKGETATAPAPELALIGQVVRHAPHGVAVGAAIGAASVALAEARALADHVRSGLSSGFGYAVALLVVTTIVALIWLGAIAPQFDAMYAQAGASVPGLTRFLFDQSWVLFLAIAILGLALVALVLATRRAALRIETIAPLGTGFAASALGARLREAHERWRVLTLAQAWTAGGGEPLASASAAARALDHGDAETSQVTAELRLAEELGSAKEELEFLSQESVAAYRDALELRRAVAIKVIQVAIAIVVGVVVIAIYLPLLKMGAVV
jgi:hypothetical protein